MSFVLNLVDEEKTNVANTTKMRQIRKFLRLRRTRDKRITLDCDKVVKNLSAHPLTESETEALALGLNFAVAPKTVPTINIITAFENAANELPEGKALELKMEVKKRLLGDQEPT